MDPIGKSFRVGNDELLVIGVIEKIGSVLGQDQDNFIMVPLPVFLRMQGAHTSLTINVKTNTGDFEKAQDQADLVLRARRHLSGKMEDDFFIGTKESYMALWRRARKDRKSTRLNSSHGYISYAVFCLNKIDT